MFFLNDKRINTQHRNASNTTAWVFPYGCFETLPRFFTPSHLHPTSDLAISMHSIFVASSVDSDRVAFLFWKSTTRPNRTLLCLCKHYHQQFHFAACSGLLDAPNMSFERWLRIDQDVFETIQSPNVSSVWSLSECESAHPKRQVVYGIKNNATCCSINRAFEEMSIGLSLRTDIDLKTTVSLKLEAKKSKDVCFAKCAIEFFYWFDLLEMSYIDRCRV